MQSAKKTNYKGHKVTKPQPVFLYNRYMLGVDLTDQFLQYNSFLHKSVKWLKKFFAHCLNMGLLNTHILHKKYSDSKGNKQTAKALAFQDRTSKAHVE